jgi:hypothetical protein
MSGVLVQVNDFAKFRLGGSIQNWRSEGIHDILITT